MSDVLGAMLRQAGHYLATGDQRAAEALLRRTLAQAPGQPDALVMLGVALAMRDAHADAVLAFDGALRARPGFPQAMAQKARSLDALDRSDEAVALAEAAGRGAQDAYTLDTAGVVLTHAGLHEKAAALYARAAKAGGAPGYHYNHAMALVYLGRFDEAQGAFRECLARDPQHGPAWAGLVQITKQTPEQNEIPRLTALAQRMAGDRIALHAIGHALAKAHEDIGDPAQAMAWLLRAKARLRKPGGEAIDAALFSAAEASLSVRTPGAAQGAPIFVTGMPRTGTTLTERILSSHSAIASAGELGDLPAVLKAITGLRSSRLLTGQLVAAAGEADPDTVGSSYMARAAKRLGIDGRFVDKLPENIFLAPLILRTLPDARVICLKRHPADTVLGSYRQAFAPGAGDVDYALDLAETARYVVRFEAMVRRFAEALPPDRFIVVRYEDIVGDLETQVRRMLAFCGLAFEEACLRFEENAAPVATASAAQVRRPINAEGVGRWRRYRPAIDAALRILIDGGAMDENELG